MERKEDIILECVMVKGRGLDFFGVVYQEKGEELKALIRQLFSGNRVFFQYLKGETQKGLSRQLMEAAGKLALKFGLHPVHLVYPGGIRESGFLHGLREAQKEGERQKRTRDN
jgi:hypothetical protein